MFDAVIVGGRCAGAATALLLARAGRRVLVLERASFPSDVLSTHFLWPRGCSYLNRWGLLEPLLEVTPSGTELRLTVEGVALEGKVPLELLQKRLRAVHGHDPAYAVQTYCSPRRRVLDTLLLDAARSAGAEVRTGVRVEGLVREGVRVVGVRARSEGGELFEARARVVVGADGRRSVVAREAGAKTFDERPRCTFAYFTYLEGLPLEGARMFRRGRLGCALVPTNFARQMTLVWGPREWFESFLADPERNFFEAIERTAPEIAPLVRERGRRVEKFQGTADQSAYRRDAAGPGWALAGDAACFKDQCTATGMTHAFRDAELLAAAIDGGLGAGHDLDRALCDYAFRRSEDLGDYLDFVGVQAEMNPTRPDELELYSALASDPAQRERFFAAFGDTAPVRVFFASSNLARLRASAPPFDADPGALEARWVEAFENPFAPPAELSVPTPALYRTRSDFTRPLGRNLLARTEGFGRWQKALLEGDVWLFNRALETGAGPEARVRDEKGHAFDGVNFAAQDYLSLGVHPAVREAAIRAITDYGPHSAGTAALIGNSRPSLELEREIAELLETPHVTLFPTGWAAGYGSIVALVRQGDHVVLDRFAHACLQAGAAAATRNVVRHPHLHLGSVEERLRAIRARDAKNGILVVTEGLFSVDSDVPDLEPLQALCRAYEATLLVDVAHDLGATGPGGAGTLGLQRLLGKVDLVMGSFSKTFASNGGFLATRSQAVAHYVRAFGGSHTFSNALSPVQATVAREAMRIVRSREGDDLRARLHARVIELREGLERRGLVCLGQPSPLVPVLVGEERLLRLMCPRIVARKVHVNPIEFPAVATGESRIRLQVMTRHTSRHVALVASALAEAHAEAAAELRGPSPRTSFLPAD